jgi:hypothetical protein
LVFAHPAKKSKATDSVTVPKAIFDFRIILY